MATAAKMVKLTARVTELAPGMNVRDSPESARGRGRKLEEMRQIAKSANPMD
jgi:hypothetical protein